jgi:hypothetical protein
MNRGIPEEIKKRERGGKGEYTFLNTIYYFFKINDKEDREKIHVN